MHLRVLTHIVALLFATAIIIPRVANLHALDHVSDDTFSISCELCDILLHSFQLDLINDYPSGLKNELVNIPTSFVVLRNHHIPQEKIVSPTSFYNRPPPRA